MPPWIKGLIVVTLIAIGVVVLVQRADDATQETWSSFHRAAQSETSLDDLEDLRRASAGSDAEPWIALELAFQLYERGDLEQIRRAVQVADEALDAYPDHAAADKLKSVKTAASTYVGT